MSIILVSLLYIQTMKKQSLCLDNDGSIIETSDSISFNFSTEVFSVNLQSYKHFQ